MSSSNSKFSIVPASKKEITMALRKVNFKRFITKIFHIHKFSSNSFLKHQKKEIALDTISKFFKPACGKKQENIFNHLNF